MSIGTTYYSAKVTKHNFNKIYQTVSLCLKEAIFNMSRQWEIRAVPHLLSLIFLLTNAALKEN